VIGAATLLVSETGLDQLVARASGTGAAADPGTDSEEAA
jgi:hypothetical protein